MADEIEEARLLITSHAHSYHRIEAGPGVVALDVSESQEIPVAPQPNAWWPNRAPMRMNLEEARFGVDHGARTGQRAFAFPSCTKAAMRDFPRHRAMDSLGQ